MSAGTSMNLFSCAYCIDKVCTARDDMVYLHQLVPADQMTQEQDASWQGKLLALEKIMRTTIQGTEDRAARDKQEYEAEMSAIKQSVDQTAGTVQELKSQIEDGLAQNARMQESLCQILQRLEQSENSR